MAGLKERFESLINKDKFDAEFKNALKRHNFSVINKISDTLYELSSGTASFHVDIYDAKRQYDINKNDEQLEKVIRIIELQCVTESKMISFTNGQSLLRFIVMREDEIKQDYIYTDFVNGLKKVLVYTADDFALNMLNVNYMKKWGMPKEVLFSVADRNMCRLLDKAEIKEADLSDNVKAIEFNLPSKELCVSMMMCNEFRKVVYSRIGAKFLVLAPSREILLVLENITNNILEGLGNVIVNEYKKAKHPLSTNVFLYTPNDIQVVGRFSAD